MRQGRRDDHARDARVARVDGVDISDKLVQVARENLRRMGIRHSTIVCADADGFADFDAYTHLYMYNPFPRAVMRATLHAIAQSWRRRPRRLTLIYVTPDDHDLIVDAGFRTVREFDDPNHRTFVYVLDDPAAAPPSPRAA